MQIRYLPYYKLLQQSIRKKYLLIKAHNTFFLHYDKCYFAADEWNQIYHIKTHLTKLFLFLSYYIVYNNAICTIFNLNDRFKVNACKKAMKTTTTINNNKISNKNQSTCHFSKCLNELNFIYLVFYCCSVFLPWLKQWNFKWCILCLCVSAQERKTDKRIMFCFLISLKRKQKKIKNWSLHQVYILNWYFAHSRFSRTSNYLWMMVSMKVSINCVRIGFVNQSIFK